MSETSGGVWAVARRINLRHLARRRLRSSLTIVGIAAGVGLALSIAVINATLLDSFRASVRDLAGKAEIEVASADATGLARSSIKAVRRVEGVEQVIPALRATAEIGGAEGSARILVLGVTTDFPALFPRALVPETELSVGVPDGLLLAEGVADRLGVRPGDPVDVATPDGLVPVTVAGLARGGGLGALNAGDVGFMLLGPAQKLFDRGDRVDSIYVIADPQRPLAEVASGIETTLGGAAVVGPPGTRSDGLEQVFEGLGSLLSMAGTVALFVSMFVVYNTMSMSLAERRRELSTALSLGATRRQLFVGFLTEATVLGVASSALGVGGGLLLARILVHRALDAYRVVPLTGSGDLSVSLGPILVAATAGVGVAILGALIPARRVMGVAPIEALRPEGTYEWSRRAGAGIRSLLTVALGVVAIIIALLSFAIFLVLPDQVWIPTVGLVTGLAGVTLLLPRIVPPAVDLMRPMLMRLSGAIGRLAADALAKNPGRTTFTVAALVLTLGVAVGVGGAIGSYEARVRGLASALVGADLYVSAESFNGLTSDQPLQASLREDLGQIPGVAFVYPLRFTFVNVGDEVGVLYTAPMAELLAAGASTDLEGARMTDTPEEFIDGLERGEIALSRFAADRRGVNAGDSLELRTPEGTERFRIAVLFDDLLNFDSIYMDYEIYVDKWGDDKADEFGLLLADGADEGTVAASVQGLIDSAGIPARLETRDQLLDFISATVEKTFALGQGIQLAALVVAAVTIANTMFTAVYERRWEMGLQRAIGMSNPQMSRSVLLEAASIGAIGGTGGALLGMATGFLMTQAMEAQFSWRIPFEVQWSLIGLAIVGGILIATIAGIVPGRMSVRVPIIESLRYE